MKLELPAECRHDEQETAYCIDLTDIRRGQRKEDGSDDKAFEKFMIDEID